MNEPESGLIEMRVIVRNPRSLEQLTIYKDVQINDRCFPATGHRDAVLELCLEMLSERVLDEFGKP